MYRRIADFERQWDYERAATLKVLRALTEASLGREVAPGGRTLGRLAWHLVTGLSWSLQSAGLPTQGPARDAPQPALAEIVRRYEEVAGGVVPAVKGAWSDDTPEQLLSIHGQHWPRGQALFALITHQAHHRGQMTVLMRQAGLQVPGVYGPAREEWAALALPPQP